ncbi:MAG: DedA family protein [Chloroflexales bacterium]|nr:DedA family protein [Chloroflexales bacterium]
MSIGDLQDWLLTMIVTYGVLALAGVLFLGGLGVPLPTTLTVLAGGAFVQQGVLDLAPALALAFVGVVLGDTLSYGIGRSLRRPIGRRYGQSAPWQRAEAYFARRGELAIYLTRCVLTAIALPINLIAGSSGYSLRRFVAYDALGELTWLVCYGALGYVFGSQWEAVSDLVSDFSGVIVGALIAGVGIYALVRWQRRPAPVAVA